MLHQQYAHPPVRSLLNHLDAALAACDDLLAAQGSAADPHDLLRLELTAIAHVLQAREDMKELRLADGAIRSQITLFLTVTGCLEETKPSGAAVRLEAAATHLIGGRIEVALSGRSQRPCGTSSNSASERSMTRPTRSISSACHHQVTGLGHEPGMHLGEIVDVSARTYVEIGKIAKPANGILPAFTRPSVKQGCSRGMPRVCEALLEECAPRAAAVDIGEVDADRAPFAPSHLALADRPGLLLPQEDEGRQGD